MADIIQFDTGEKAKDNSPEWIQKIVNHLQETPPDIAVLITSKDGEMQIIFANLHNPILVLGMLEMAKNDLIGALK